MACAWHGLRAPLLGADCVSVLLMVPLPGPLLNDSTLKLEMLSTAFANKLLHLMTFHTVVQGSVIQMDNFQPVD